MDVGDLLIAKQKTSFVGRSAEWEKLMKCLTDPEWQWLHLYGPGGIGKTTLLRLFGQSIGPSRCLYFDGHHDFQRPQDFLQHVRKTIEEFQSLDNNRETIERLNAYAAKQGSVMLLFDTFERWGPIENWLRQEWLPKLSPHVKICSAGRYPLEDQWLRNGWHALVHNMELQPLTFVEIETYAQIRGIVDQQTVTSLQQFSNGLPLALSLACEIILRKKSTQFLDQDQKDSIITYLIEELTRDLEDKEWKRFIEVASVVWRFDQELLQTMLKKTIQDDHFREFCRLPFVIRQADGWTLHDSIRQWVFTELRNRMPKTFQTYRKRAFKALQDREILFPHKKSELAFERLYLHELDFVRDFRFQWDDRLRFRECKAQDLEQIEKLYLTHLHHQSNFVNGEAHLESLIRPLWRIDPSAFYGLWRGQELVAFCSCIQLTDVTVHIFRNNPLTRPVTSRYRSDRRQFLLSITGVATHLERDITGSIARALVQIIERNNEACFLDLISIPYWREYLPLLGFQRASWADATTPLGVQYLGYQLDLHHENLSTRLNRMYSFMESSVRQPEEVELSLEEAVKLMQQALKNFQRLPFLPKIAYSLRPLISESDSEWMPEKIAELVQNDILRIMETFLKGSNEEQRFYRILYHAYIKKIGTHEIVSEYLNIPIKSYYRYLKIAVQSLTYQIIRKK